MGSFVSEFRKSYKFCSKVRNPEIGSLVEIDPFLLRTFCKEFSSDMSKFLPENHLLVRFRLQ